VIAVGASLNAYTAALGDLFGDARLVQVDSRPGGPELSAYDLAARPVNPLHLSGDAKTVLSQLREAIPARAGGWRDDDAVIRLLAVDPRQVAIENRPAALARGTLDPRELMLALDAGLPHDAAITVGVGNFTWFPLQYLRNPGRRDFYFALDFVAIGQALATAIGAAIGVPQRPHVAIEGDASFMMHVQELETAARYSVPVLAFVLNDGALGAEYHKLKAAGMDPAESLLPAADVCEVATAFGARATRLSDPADLARVLTWFDPSEGPHVVDCPTSLSVAGPA
jgi:thiamine pyrophosphate-dependent acetolactate synthase large subunit-like protein